MSVCCECCVLPGGVLWTSDQLIADTSTRQHTTLTRDKYPCPWRDSNLTISAGERPQTYALDCAATGAGDTKDTLPQL
jgi:hypothetical protein